MYKRLQLIENALAAVATVGPSFLDDVNTFPSVSVLRPSLAGKIGEHHQNVSSRRATTTRNSIGNRATLDALSFTIRGYTHTSIETAIDDAEQLARDIEYAVQTLRSPLIYSAKVTSVHTDEGLFAPYGVCDIQCVVEWINE